MEARQLFVEYRATLGPGGVELWLGAGALAANLVKTLRVAPSSARFESTGVNPDEFQLALFLFQVGLVVRYRVDSLGITALNNADAFQTQEAVEVLDTALGALHETAPGAEILGQRVVISAHVDTAPNTFGALVSRYVKNEPEGFKTRSLSFERDLGGGTVGAVFIEPSAIITDSGAFCQVACTFPSTEAPKDIPARARVFWEEAQRVILSGGER